MMRLAEMSEEEDEELEDDVSSVDSMENWKPQHL